MTTAYGTDFGIVAPLRVEFDALLAALGKYTAHERVAIDTRTYYTMTFPNCTGAEYHIVITLLPSMGNISSALATHDMLQHWRPRNLLVIGIAGGINPKEQAIGDIIIPDMILYYELGKIRPEKAEVRPRMLTVDPTLYDRAFNFRVRDQQPRVHFGPLASGEKVYANAAAVKRLLKLHPKLVGIEMESAGVASAALSAVEKTAFLAIRAVSDFADAHKDDQAHGRAARAAATWLTNFLRSATRQFEHQGFVQLGNGQELKAVQALDHGKACLMNAAFRGPALTVHQFQFRQPQQETRVVQALAGALPGHLVVLAQEGGQPQQLQLMFQQNLGRIVRSQGMGAHAGTSPSSAI